MSMYCTPTTALSIPDSSSDTSYTTVSPVKLIQPKTTNAVWVGFKDREFNLLLFLKGWNLMLSLPQHVPTTSCRERRLEFNFPTGFSGRRLARSGIYFAVVIVVFFYISHECLLLLCTKLLRHPETLCWCFLSLGCIQLSRIFHFNLRLRGQRLFRSLLFLWIHVSHPIAW